MDSGAAVSLALQPDVFNASSSAGVFRIVELLEAILLQTEERTLLLSQRVNITFRDTIKGSPALQQRLHFQKTSATDDESLHVNPLLFKPFSSFPHRPEFFCDFQPIAESGECLPGFRRGFVIMKNDEGRNEVTAPEGSWRDMLVVGNGREFRCMLYAKVLINESGERRLMGLVEWFAGDLTVGEFVDWILEGAEQVRVGYLGRKQDEERL